MRKKRRRLSTAELEELAARLWGVARQMTAKQAEASRLQAEADKEGKGREARRHEYEAGKAQGKREWAEHRLRCIEEELAFRRKYSDE